MLSSKTDAGDKAPVVVLGKNYSTVLGVIRALGEAEYSVELYFVAYKKGISKVPGSSRYVTKCVEGYGRDDSEHIRQILDSFAEEDRKKVLLPTDDYTTSLVDRYADQFAEYFLFPGVPGKSGEVTALMDKETQMALARQYGLRTVSSWTVDLTDDAIVLPEALTYPCFPKPLASVDGGKCGMVRCDTEEDLLAELKSVRAKYGNIRMLVQEYVEIEQEFSISGLCFNGTVLLPARLRKLRTGIHYRGITVLGRVEPFPESGKMHQALAAMLRATGFNGLIDTEVFVSRGHIYYNETNFRSSAVLYGLVYAGANLPALLVEALLADGQSVETVLANDLPDGEGLPAGPQAAESTLEKVQGSDLTAGESAAVEDNKEAACFNIRYGTIFLCERGSWSDLLFRNISLKEYRRMNRLADCCTVKNPQDPDVTTAFRRMCADQFVRRAGKTVLTLDGHLPWL